MKTPDKDGGKERIAYFPFCSTFKKSNDNETISREVANSISKYSGGPKKFYWGGSRVPNQSQYITTHLWEPIYVLHANAQDTRGLVSGLWHSNLWSPLKKTISEGQLPKKLQFSVEGEEGTTSLIGAITRGNQHVFYIDTPSTLVTNARYVGAKLFSPKAQNLKCWRLHYYITFWYRIRNYSKWSKLHFKGSTKNNCLGIFPK